LPPWKPGDALGRAGGSVFTRASGKKLSDGIPGFLTVEGFHKVLLPALSTATREVASESWVLGQKVPGSLDLAQQSNVANEVVKLYLDDYAKAWDGLLQDIEIAPLRSLNQASQDLYILASKQSPLKEFLVAVSRQLTLSEPPKSTSLEAAAAEAEKAAKDKAAAVAPTLRSRPHWPLCWPAKPAPRPRFHPATRSTSATSSSANWFRHRDRRRSTKC